LAHVPTPNASRDALRQAFNSRDLINLSCLERGKKWTGV
jgi:hypothetical protein